MLPQRHSVTLTTSDLGVASGTLSNIEGELCSVAVVAGAAPFANGATVTITGSVTGIVYVNAWQCDAAGVIHPRCPTTDSAGTPAVYAGAGEAVLDRFAIPGEDLLVVIGSGDATKSGTVILITA